jgi:methionine-rich copper-binding protein CopC
MMSRLTILTLTLAATLAAPLPALAHAHLKAASPAADAVVTSAPSEVALDFSEDVEPKFSSIEVDDAKGARVDKGDVHVAPDNAKHLAVWLKPLEPGTYKVIWRVLSTDTHKSNGSYSFKLEK